MPVPKCFCVAVALTAVGSSAITVAVFWLFSRVGQSAASDEKKPQKVDESTEEVVPVLSGRDGAKKSSEVYESEESARQYMEFHYTPTSESYTQALVSITDSFDFPRRLAGIFAKFPPKTESSETRALDIGCATGASVLEMSKYFGSVIGIDYSETFIHLALEVLQSCKTTGCSSVEYTAPDQGEVTLKRSLSGLSGTFPDRCSFYCGDAMHLLQSDCDGDIATRTSTRYSDVKWYQVPSGERFDAVLAANLLCRVPDPLKLLETFPKLLHRGGVLVLVSPYSWWEGATPRDKWIGGKVGGLRSEEAVKKILMDSFELLSETDEAFLIRDHVRRYQLGFSHCTVWRRC